MILKAAISLTLLGITGIYAPKQFPESRFYKPNVDTGYKQYETLSIHNTNKYVLTYDDGPHITNTPKILDLLKKHNVKATFFIVTSRLNDKTFPIFKRILDEGHIAASHHHEHDNNNKVDYKTFKLKLKKSILELASYYKKAGYDYSKIYYRFPYAAYGENKKYHHMNVIKEVSDELFKDNCINFAFWDADSGDWIPTLSSLDVFENMKSYHLGGRYISYRVRKINRKKKIIKKPIINDSPTKGGVILLHDIQNRTIGATKKYLNWAKDNNIEFVNLDSIDEFSFKNKDCKLVNDL
ncbi:MAG: polysaccharide deacetylase family protein [Bacteriovoracaceae bacterium]|jgi:peptidoglycan/xylan/chitin deacetylase (PgdA/CDA1 family)|nr:polysaccharide deacetylase family protein [Bacteriovoracaceae bacterium]